jgi:hypothetical protein
MPTQNIETQFVARTLVASKPRYTPGLRCGGLKRRLFRPGRLTPEDHDERLVSRDRIRDIASDPARGPASAEGKIASNCVAHSECGGFQLNPNRIDWKVEDVGAFL